MSSFEPIIIKDLIIAEARDFEVHLSDNQNSRILFSGKFGKGKTTFLNQFFSNQSGYLTNGKKYIHINISPISYSIASNEDIIKYIKYDILMELMKINLDVEDFNFSIDDVLYNFLSSNYQSIIFEVFKNITEYIPKVGKPVGSLLDIIHKYYEKIKVYKAAINNGSPSELLTGFMSKIENESNSIYENDIVTILIEKLIVKAKNKDENELESVLIIDDLDRIDPEHIFRILNVFSSHFDTYERVGKFNKFGFDKTIVVCDIKNIRSIFSHKYGGNVDFSGYIDKFYSKEIYYFKNYKQINKVASNLVNEIEISIRGYDTSSGGHFKHLLSNLNIGIEQLIVALINSNNLSLRTVFNIKNKKLLVPEYPSLYKRLNIKTSEYSFYIEVIILNELLGGYDNAEKIIKNLIENKMPIDNHIELFNNLLLILTCETHEFRNQIKEFSFEINEKANCIEISFSNEKDRLEISQVYKTNMSHREILTPTVIDYYNMLLKVMNVFHVEKIIE